MYQLCFVSRQDLERRIKLRRESGSDLNRGRIESSKEWPLSVLIGLKAEKGLLFHERLGQEAYLVKLNILASHSDALEKAPLSATHASRSRLRFRGNPLRRQENQDTKSSH